jgi:hypothetical protein
MQLAAMQGKSEGEIKAVGKAAAWCADNGLG